MGRRYVYAQGTGVGAALEAAAAAAKLSVRIVETADLVEVLCDDGPAVVAWERNQPLSASLVEPVADGSPSLLVATVPAVELEAVLVATTDAELAAAKDALAARIEGAKLDADVAVAEAR